MPSSSTLAPQRSLRSPSLGKGLFLMLTTVISPSKTNTLIVAEPEGPVRLHANTLCFVSRGHYRQRKMTPQNAICCEIRPPWQRSRPQNHSSMWGTPGGNARSKTARAVAGASSNPLRAKADAVRRPE